MSLLWIIGEAHADFADAIQWLQSHAACRFFADLRAALNELEATNSSPPAAMIFLQTRSGQFHRSKVEQIHAAAPLTPLICMTGPWCEGESRSGRPLAGVTRIPWRAWRQRLPHELAAAMHCNGSPGRSPRTASDAERIEKSLAHFVIEQHGRTAVVSTASRAAFEAIGNMLGRLRMAAQWCRALDSLPAARGNVLICDGWEQLPRNHDFERPPTLLLLHFPRPQDERRATRDRIAAIVAQPLLLGDFAAAIGKALAAHVDGCGRP
jgi:hypothetical protein